MVNERNRFYLAFIAHFLLSGDQTLNWRLTVRSAVLVIAAALVLREDAPRSLVWIDYRSVAGGTLGLLGLCVYLAVVGSKRKDLLVPDGIAKAAYLPKLEREALEKRLTDNRSTTKKA